MIKLDELGPEVDAGMEELFHLGGVNAHHRLFLGDQPLLHHIHGDLHRRLGGPLASARLEHPQLSSLDGELHVLHIAIVMLQKLTDADELLVSFGQFLRHLLDGLGGTDAGHHVLALGVEEIIAKQLLLACGGVAGEGHARSRIEAHVAEDHSDDVYRRP